MVKAQVRPRGPKFLLKFSLIWNTDAEVSLPLSYTDITNHFPIFTTTCNPSSTNFNHQFCINKRSQVRQLKPDNIKGLKNGLYLTNFNDILTESDPEVAFDKFGTKLNNLLNIHCPIKTTKISKRLTPKKPWFTSSIIKSIHTKDELYKQYITKPNRETKLKYTKYRNTLNSLLRASEKNHFSSQLNLHKNNMKKTWETLNLFKQTH